MGLGKTAATLDAIGQLLYDYMEVSKVLVIAPKNVAESTWEDEIGNWDIFYRLRDKIAFCGGTASNRHVVALAKKDITTIARDNIKWLVEFWGKDWPYDMVVIDESSSFKNSSSGRFKYLQSVSPLFDRCVLLSGTPASRGYINLWSQIYLLDRGERLEKYITHFRNKYFDYDPYTYAYTLKSSMDEVIVDKVKDITIGMDNEDYLIIEKPVINDIIIRMDDDLLAKYKLFVKKYILPEANDTDIIARNAASLSAKLLQFASGEIYDEQKKVHHLHDYKMDELERIIEEAQGEPVLIFYNYRHELARIQKKFKAVLLKGKKEIDKWNNGEIPIMIASPQSCGYGLNLQHGGHIEVWFSPTFDLELYDQANARVARPGQKQTVVIHRILMEGTRDMEAVARLQTKGYTQQQFINSIKGEIENVFSQSNCKQ
jgi:SNF2 family DNA or RNA helicase